MFFIIKKKLKQIILFLVVLFIGISIAFDNYYFQNRITGIYIFDFPILTVNGSNDDDCTNNGEYLSIEKYL